MALHADRGNKTGLSQDEFLAACFKCAKEKITIDYEKLAKLTGMSKGGAQNKYRDLTKKLDLLAPAGDTVPSTPVHKIPASTSSSGKRKAAVKESTDHDSASDVDGADHKPLAKKAKASTTKTGTAKLVKKRGKQDSARETDLKVKEEDSDDDIESNEESAEHFATHSDAGRDEV